MANLPEVAQWTAEEDGIYQFELDDFITGGPGGNDNEPHRLLANRTRFLRETKADKNGSASERFKVAPASANDEAVNKEQLSNAISSIDLTKYALKHDHPYVPTSDISIGTSPNTIPKRDSSGDIRARLFRSEYPTNTLNPPLFCVQQEAGVGNNNYIRNVTKESVANTLAPLVGAALTGWLPVTKINGWTGNLWYKKWKDGTVIVTGAPYNAVCSANYTVKQIGALPVGYRPSTTIYGVAQTNALQYQTKIYIDSAGRIFAETVGQYYHYITLIFKIG